MVLPAGRPVPVWSVAPPVPGPRTVVAAQLLPQQAAVPTAGGAVKSAKIEVGAAVEVLETFKSNSKGDKATLKPGQKGTVLKLDEDGDAFIKFDDHTDKEWVVRANFHKLRAVTDHSGEGQEAPVAEKRRTRGVALQPAAAFSPQEPPQQLSALRAPVPPLDMAKTGPVQKQMESRLTALQAQAAAMDMHQAMLESERERVIQSRTNVIQGIQALHREIEKQKAGSAWMVGQPGSRSFGIDSQASTSAGSPSVMDEFENMREGATVTVLEDFMSNSKGARVQLMVGQKGVVSRVDSDGDVLVKFKDHPDKEWITRNNFDMLRVSKAAKVPKADGPAVTEVSNSGSICRC